MSEPNLPHYCALRAAEKLLNCRHDGRWVQMNTDQIADIITAEYSVPITSLENIANYKTAQDFVGMAGSWMRNHARAALLRIK